MLGQAIGNGKIVVILIKKLKLVLIAAALIVPAGAFYLGDQYGVSRTEVQYKDALLVEQARVRGLTASLRQVTTRHEATIRDIDAKLRQLPDPDNCNTDRTLGTELDRLCDEGYDAAC